MNNVNLPEEVYNITAIGHFSRALSIRHHFMTINPLQFSLYAALELRNAIERLLFEYLVIIQGSEKISKSLEKEYRANSLKKIIETIEPELSKKIKYINLALCTIGKPPMVVLDLDVLSDLYARLNNYLHAWKRPEKTAQQKDWWSGLWQTLDEIEEILGRIYSGTIAHIKLNEKAMENYEAWKKKELSDEEVVIFFRKEFQNLP